MALLAAAGVAGERTRFREAAAALEKIAAKPFRTLALIETFWFSPGAGSRRIEAILPALQPLAAEVNYALLGRYRPPLAATEP
jgi:hypothetical protein